MEDNNILLGCILFFMIIMAFVVKQNKKSFLNRYTDKLGLVCTIFIPWGMYVTYMIFKSQNAEMSRDSTYTIVDRSFLSVNNLIVQHYHSCPKFVNSLYYNWQKNILGKFINVDKHSKDNGPIVNYLSVAIFQAWEDWLTSSSVDESEAVTWITIFITWAHSDILYDNWSILKSNYDVKTTQQLGDFLFHTARLHYPKNNSELLSIANDAISSKKFKNILNTRNN